MDSTINRLKSDLERKIASYNQTISTLGTNEGELGHQLALNLKTDIKHLLRLLEEQGEAVKLNQPERGPWSIIG